MSLAFAAAIAVYSAVLGRVEAVLADSLGLEDPLARAGLAGVAALSSVWGIALGVRKARSVSGRRKAFIASALTVALALAASQLPEAPVPLLFASLVAAAMSLGLAGFAASNTIYNEVDYSKWRGVVALYYIASSLGGSLLGYLSKGIPYWEPLALASVAVGLVAARSVRGSVLSNTSLKIIENFANAAAGLRVAKLRPWEVVRASSLLGSLSAVKLEVAQQAAIALGGWTPVAYGASYAIGALLAYTSPSLAAASIAGITALVVAATSIGSPASLVAVGVAMGYASLSTVYYVIDAAPRRLRIVSIAIAAWTVLGALAVGVAHTLWGPEAGVKVGIAVATLGLIAAERARQRSGRPQWA